MAPWTRSRVIVTIVALAVLTGAVIGVRALWDKAQHALSSPSCTFGDFSLSPGQTAVASTMVGVVNRRGLPERAAVLVLAAAYQESKLTNLAPGMGDRDSVGVLQQRPSQGWGTIEQLSDVHYATAKFLDELVKHENWKTTSIAHAIQQVQISADEDAYNQHVEQATALAHVLMGKVPVGLTCEFDAPTVVASAATVATQVKADLPVNAPVTSGSTVRVPGAKWATAMWFVANADRLGIDTVEYAGHRWTREKGWSGDTSIGTDAVSAILGTPKK